VLERCAEFVRLKADFSETPSYCPMDVVRDLMNLPEWLTVPPLAGIVECPIILPDGAIISNQGYDKGTRLFYAPDPDLMIPAVPGLPSQTDVENAVKLIREVFQDFPFSDDASRTNMIGTLLTAVLRPLIKGPVPMAIIDKPQAGTGATLLSETVALIATGRPAALMSAPTKEEEWTKKITSALQLGRGLVVLDNIESKIYSPSLALVLTSNTWTDRVLGTNRMVTLPHTMTWISTGNNTQLGGDLPRRCYWIRLDAKSARPWQRTNYTHPELLEWVGSQRGCILNAILTITRAWVLAGRPKPDEKVPKVGGFESWRDLIGGILEYCKIPSFLENLESMYELIDGDTPQWESFVEKWYSIWKKPVTVAEIQEHLQKESNSTSIEYAGDDHLCDLLPDALADAWAGKKNFSRVLGKALSRMNGRVFLNGLTLQKGKVSHSAVTWVVAEPAKGGSL
jgi:hypothetical protein